VTTLPNAQFIKTAPAPTTGRIILSINQVADLCGVTRRTVNYWITQGKVEIRRGVGAKRYVYADSVNGFADFVATRRAGVEL
jgi:DNA-binding transcriptional MerR regulator